MALGVDKTSLVLASGTIQKGTWTNAELIGTDAVRPRGKFSGTEMGSIKRGTQVVNLPKEYVEAMKKTPSELFRKDVISQRFTIEGEIFEFTGDSLSVFMNRTAQLAYAVTSPATETWDIIHLGSNAPAIVEAGYLILATDVNGNEFEIAMYAGLLTPEGQSVNQTGDDYAVVQVKLEASPYTGQTDDEKNYGYIAKRTA